MAAETRRRRLSAELFDLARSRDALQFLSDLEAYKRVSAHSDSADCVVIFAQTGESSWFKSPSISGRTLTATPASLRPLTSPCTKSQNASLTYADARLTQPSTAFLSRSRSTAKM